MRGAARKRSGPVHVKAPCNGESGHFPVKSTEALAGNVRLIRCRPLREADEDTVSEVDMGLALQGNGATSQSDALKTLILSMARHD